MRQKNKKSKPELPFVFLNIAMTADGKLATANRAVSSFGSRHDLRHLLALRATADAVMNGARTADLNKITMGPGSRRYRQARLKRGLTEYNLRVIVSGSGTLDPRAEVFKHKFSPTIILVSRRVAPRKLAALRAVADEVKICGQREIDFARALRWLRQEWKVRRLLCEGGGEINDALFREGLVNELHVTVTPYLFGGRQAPTLADGRGALRLSQATNLVLKSARRRGQELFLVYRAKKSMIRHRSG